MKLIPSLLFSSLTAVVLAAPKAATPKLLICSDSTTQNYAITNALQGWGFHIPAYLSIPVTNLAIGGRSTRLFIAEGRWQALLNKTVAGDFVLVEMGHNDDADPTKGEF